MNKIQKVFLNQRVIPAIIMFSLLPRSVNYSFSQVDIWESIRADLFVSFYAVLSLGYLITRYLVVVKYINDKRAIIFDTICVIVGVFMDCVYIQSNSNPLLFCITTIPLYVNNYKVLMKNGRS